MTSPFDVQRIARAAAIAGQVVAIGLLTACAGAPRARLEVAEARRDFSQDRYCPLARVAGADAAVAAPPSDAVARDPERLAMWRDAMARRAPTKRVVVVQGCGESAVYACWAELVSKVPVKHGYQRTYAAVCLEQPADAVVSASAPK